MIPKIIHFCWLSDDEFPPLIKKCMDSWKEKLSDYEFVHWNTDKFNMESSLWVQQAFEVKKYAFAADYIRLYAVYHYGGIYLDTDIEVIKRFDDLLNRPYFAGTEGERIIEAGVFGAVKGSAWLKQCLSYYENRSFIKPDGSFDTMTLPRIMMKQISKTKTFETVLPETITPEEQNKDTSTMYLFPKDHFCAKNHGTGQIEKTKNTYCIHHFAMSWVDKNHTFLPNIKRKLMRVLGVKFVDSVIKILGLRKIKKLFKRTS
ncbi:glycosyltransferase family 32 protein [Gaetbulibacter aestuarii]|uniref:Glycosyltransferase n=1 Tax=Gaetbulibacter aestuarii TaxID=1502358 RepID=A0ABW7N0R8_9FLAO